MLIFLDPKKWTELVKIFVEMRAHVYITNETLFWQETQKKIDESFVQNCIWRIADVHVSISVDMFLSEQDIILIINVTYMSIKRNLSQGAYLINKFRLYLIFYFL